MARSNNVCTAAKRQCRRRPTLHANFVPCNMSTNGVSKAPVFLDTKDFKYRGTSGGVERGAVGVAGEAVEVVESGVVEVVEVERGEEEEHVLVCMPCRSHTVTLAESLTHIKAT